MAHVKLTAVEAMRLAISEAQKGAGFVSPNPLVGCVILDRNFELLAKGYHAHVGGDHAEISALKQIINTEHLAGAHLFVTLEPCAHQGRTPSCALALAKLPLASVTYGLLDPFPQVSGQGIQILKSAGISVSTLPELNDELEELAEIFLYNQRQKQSFLAVKVAASLDGQCGLKSGESQWITGESSRAHAHYLRGCYDAVMVGVKTYLADNPSLNARNELFVNKNNFVVIVDPDLRSLPTLKESNLLKQRPASKVIVAYRANGSDEPKQDGQSGVWLLPQPQTAAGAIDLKALIKQLVAREVSSVLVEGGGYLISQCLNQQVAQRLYLYQAPLILGAMGGLSWTQNLSIPRLSQQIHLHHTRLDNLGEDFLLSGRLVYAAHA